MVVPEPTDCVKCNFMRRTDKRAFCYEHDLGAKYYRAMTAPHVLTPEDEETIDRLLARDGRTASDEFLDAANLDP